MGAAGNQNVQGEDQKKLDVLSNDIMISALTASGKTAVLVSEENDEAIFVKDNASDNLGKYCVVFDPLDGSSNIDAGVNIGTIFGIYMVKDGSKGSLEDVLRPGREMVAAGYCMYGSSANMVLTTGKGVNGFTLDNSLGEFILTHPNITIPSRGKIYSINEGNSSYYHEPVMKYLDMVKFPKGDRKPYSARYIGSMVADVHRTLLYGGIFGYPDDKKSKAGKLRILYEAFPMAFLTEQVRVCRTSSCFSHGLHFFAYRLAARRQQAQRGSWTYSRLGSISDAQSSSARKRMSRTCECRFNLPRSWPSDE